jgi:hypothetical protein
METCVARKPRPALKPVKGDRRRLTPQYQCRAFFEEEEEEEEEEDEMINQVYTFATPV